MPGRYRHDDDLATLSADERRRVMEDFVNEVFGGLDAGPALKDRIGHTRVALPDDPTPEQVDAWVELAELVRDPDFRRRMRDMVEHNARNRAGQEPGAGGGAVLLFAGQILRWLRTADSS
ncbi:hypothetical protein ABZ860_38960 [Microbispora sp. NPDC046973]|uniref:hypothetical protein n=1 Tax=Microbispora sp. NPDC046973 TaxID=3155022 RepID=UPI0033C3584A